MNEDILNDIIHVVAIIDHAEDDAIDGPLVPVYKLAERLNAESGRERIPASIIAKAPSAELKPNQLDQDKLPAYGLLDEILRRYLEADEAPEEIVASGLDAPTVRRVVQMVDAAEFKRRQAAPVLKVTSRAFGTGRRMPIAQRYSAPN